MPEALRGDLAWISVGGLLQLAESEAFTGTVELTGGRVALLHGRPVAASFGALTGLPALLQALLQRRGSFRLETGATVAAAPPLADVATAVLEGCRLVDELDRLAPLRLRPAPHFVAEDPVVRRLVAQLDGDRTVAEALREAGVPEALAIDALVSLLERRSLVEAAPPDRGRVSAAPVAAAPEDGAELVDRARAAVRARDYRSAVDLFRKALSLRPNDRVVAQNLHRVELLLKSA